MRSRSTRQFANSAPDDEIAVPHGHCADARQYLNRCRAYAERRKDRSPGFPSGAPGAAALGAAAKPVPRRVPVT